MKGKIQHKAHKIKYIEPLKDFKLIVHFEQGWPRLCDFRRLLVFDEFKILKENPDLFDKAEVTPDKYGVVWNDDLEMSSSSLFNLGEKIMITI